jgi:hypothetical protein
MKLKINGKYEKVAFWSFFKGFFLSYLMLLAFVLLGMFILGVIVTP